MVGLFVFVSCGASTPAWQVTSIDGEPLEIGTNTRLTPRFEFSDGRLGGNMGCSSFGAEYALQGTRLRVSHLESTLEGCAIPDGSDEMVLSERVLRLLFELNEGFQASLDQDTMVWNGSDHQVILTPAD